MDISKLSIKELEELKARIPVEIEKRKAEKKEKVLNEVAALVSKHGFTLDELLGKRGTAGEHKRKGSRKPAAVKYRHPEHSELTWTGRGLKPAWVNEWLNQGHLLDALKI